MRETLILHFAHFDPRCISATRRDVMRRDAMRRNAMRSIIEIDHAEGGVADGEKIGRVKSRWFVSRESVRTSAGTSILCESLS